MEAVRRGIREAGLDDTETPMRTIVHRFDVGDQRARTLLAGCGLAIEKQGRPIAQLSGGQSHWNMAGAPGSRHALAASARSLPS